MNELPNTLAPRIQSCGTVAEHAKVGTLDLQAANINNVPSDRIEDAQELRDDLLRLRVNVDVSLKPSSETNKLIIGIGNLTLANTALFLRPSPAVQTETDSPNPGKLEWNFSGNNQLRTFQLCIGDRIWQEEFARLQLPTSSLLLHGMTLNTEAHQKVYEGLCTALKPIERLSPTQFIILQGSAGLGKTYCAQYYFYHEAAKEHQTVAWLPGSSEQTFLDAWGALAQQFRNLQSPPSQLNDNEIIRNWCENKLGQWLFIIDDANVEPGWLLKHLPKQGGHAFITTHRSNYTLNVSQRILRFSPLSISDSKQLLQAYLGKYWQATGRESEEKAMNYLIHALGGYPVALTQVALYVHKKSVSFERLAEQFKQPGVRPYLLSDTVFDQLKDKTFMHMVQKSQQQFLTYLNKRYLWNTSAEEYLRQFIHFLLESSTEDSNSTSDTLSTIVKIDKESVEAFWLSILANVTEAIDEKEMNQWLQCLPWFYEVDTQEWKIALASLCALQYLMVKTDKIEKIALSSMINLVPRKIEEEKQEKEETTENHGDEILGVSDIKSVEDKKNKEERGEGKEEIKSEKADKKETVLKIPEGIAVSVKLSDATLQHVEMNILTIEKVGKLNEFKVWKLPTVNSYFIPRPKLTDELKAKLPQKKAGESTSELLLTAATGMGGIGKTELARHFITSPELSGSYQRRFWLTATTEAQLRTEFQQLGVYLGLVESEKYVEDKDLIFRIHKWLSIHAGWVMVLDNADNYNDIANWIPREGGSVIVTTREPSPGALREDQIIPVPLLEKEEAIQWLHQLSGRDPDILSEQEKMAAKELVEKLGYLPLAIAQAAAYLREQKIILIESYLKDFSNFLADDTLARQEGMRERDAQKDSEDYSRRVISSTWMLSLREIKKAAEIRYSTDLAKPFLALCSYLASKNIPVFLLKTFLETFYHVEASLVNYVLDEHIGQLIRYSLMERNTIDNTLSVHRLVQDVIQLNLNMEEKSEYLDKTLKICDKSLPYGEGKDKLEDLVLKRILLPHFEAFLPKITQNENKALQFFTLMADAYKDLDNAKRTKELLELKLAIEKKHYGLDHPAVAITQSNLANAYGDLGDVKKKKKLLEHALEIKERYYKPDHPTVADTLNNLANAYGDLGYVKKKKELLERVLPIFEKHYGSDHPQVSIILNNLASAYWEFGDGKKSKTLLERALAIEEKYYGSDHPKVASTLSNLSNAYGSSLNDAKKSKELLERALAIQEKHYNPDHPNVAGTLRNLGSAYRDLRGSHKSKALLEQALAIAEKYYGSDHPQVAGTLVSLASTYLAMGDARKKRELLERALEIQEKYYGSGHPEVVGIIWSLGGAYLALCDANRSKELLEQALAIREKYYGSDHPDVADTLNNLANAYGALGDANKKRELLEQALSIFEKCYGPDNPQVAMIFTNLANVYLVLGDTHKSKALLEQALPIFEKYYGPHHPNVATALASLGDAYWSLDNANKSQELLKQALAIREEYYGPNHSQVAIILSNLAANYFHSEQLEMAFHFFYRAYCIFLNDPNGGSRPPNAKTAAQALHNILAKKPDLFAKKISTLKKEATARYQQGDYGNAIFSFKACLNLYPFQEKVDEESIASTLYNLGSAYWKNHDFQRALDYLKQALALRAKLGDAVGMEKVKQRIREVQKEIKQTAVYAKTLSSVTTEPNIVLREKEKYQKDFSFVSPHISGSNLTFFPGSSGKIPGVLYCHDQRYRRHAVDPDGDCGYTAFGITRQNAHELISSNINEVGDILRKLVEEVLCTDEKFIQYLPEDFMAAKEAYRSYYDALQRQGPTLEKQESSLKQHGNDLNLLLCYLDYDIKDKHVDAGWAHPLVLFALAHIQKIQLRLWELNERGEMIPHRHYPEYQPQEVEGRELTDLLFVNGNHFERLELIAERKTEEMKEIKEASSRSYGK